MLKREFEALNELVKNLESELQRLDSRGRELFPEFHSRLTNLENERTDLKLLADKVQQVFAKTPETIDVVSAPFAPEQPVGPRRTLNVLIAGVLGSSAARSWRSFSTICDNPSQRLQVDHELF
jgi:uncharacterized protein involved in exopolysaccharide biosynthesis